ncbi:MAG: ribose 5-phosphate isomerase B [Bacillota bacterium]|nr:ribose 5-phosphate isomerase B [Bacillota bacterium]
MIVSLGCDHAGVDLRASLRDQLMARGYRVISHGPEDETSVDYPDVAIVVCRQVLDGEADLGILVCGTGLGMSIAANKVPGIRAALLSDCYSAVKARTHNDANVITLGGRTLGPELAWQIVTSFLDNEFTGGRHQVRIDKLSAIESHYMNPGAAEVSTDC